jgi:hypothetical protein
MLGSSESAGKEGKAAAAGIEATGRGVRGMERAEEGGSGSTISVNGNRGGWSVGREEGNQRLLYI